jgi:hypothetical protein
MQRILASMAGGGPAFIPGKRPEGDSATIFVVLSATAGLIPTPEIIEAALRGQTKGELPCCNSRIRRCCASSAMWTVAGAKPTAAKR